MGHPKITKDIFIKRAESIHGKLYNYDDVIFIKSTDKIKIKCNKCNNIFWQYPHEHLKAKGCRICAIKDITDTKETFIKYKNEIKAVILHLQYQSENKMKSCLEKMLVIL